MSATYIGKSLNYHIVEVESIVFNDIKEIDNWCTETFGDEDAWGEPFITGWKRMQHRYYPYQHHHVRLILNLDKHQLLLYEQL